MLAFLCSELLDNFYQGYQLLSWKPTRNEFENFMPGCTTNDRDCSFAETEITWEAINFLSHVVLKKLKSLENTRLK